MMMLPGDDDSNDDDPNIDVDSNTLLVRLIMSLALLTALSRGFLGILKALVLLTLLLLLRLLLRNFNDETTLKVNNNTSKLNIIIF